MLALLLRQCTVGELHVLDKKGYIAPVIPRENRRTLYVRIMYVQHYTITKAVVEHCYRDHLYLIQGFGGAKYCQMSFS